MAKFTQPRTKEEILSEKIEQLEEQKSDKLTFLEADDNEIEVKS